MVKTSELKKELSWEQKYQQILKRKAERCLAAGHINSSIYCDNYEDCMNSYNNSIARENAYKVELLRRKELPKKIGMKVASVLIAIITLGQFHLMQ